MDSGNHTLEATRGDRTPADLDMPYGVAATQALIDENGIDVNAVPKPTPMHPQRHAKPSPPAAMRRRERMKAGFAAVAALGIAYALTR